MKEALSYRHSHFRGNDEKGVGMTNVMVFLVKR